MGSSKRNKSNNIFYQGRVVATFVRGLLLLTTALIVITTAPAQAQQGQGNLGNPGVMPPHASYGGRTYAEWSVAWWQWALGLPVPGHPFSGCPNPNDAGQTRPVWFLAGQFGHTECSLTVPHGTALFFPIANSECSNLEGPPWNPAQSDFGFGAATEAEQRACAKYHVDTIEADNLVCEIDGVPVQHLARYRFVSSQFSFQAPTPWIFGDSDHPGGSGTAVGDGYYLLLSPLSTGEHTIKFSSPNGIDSTYRLTVGR